MTIYFCDVNYKVGLYATTNIHLSDNFRIFDMMNKYQLIQENLQLFLDL